MGCQDIKRQMGGERCGCVGLVRATTPTAAMLLRTLWRSKRRNGDLSLSEFCRPEARCLHGFMERSEVQIQSYHCRAFCRQDIQCQTRSTGFLAEGEHLVRTYGPGKKASLLGP